MKRRLPLPLLAAGMGLALVLVSLASLRTGTSDLDGLGRSARGVAAWLGLASPLPGAEQTIVELRLFRVLVGLGVGAALSLSGALLQGVFRNDLASPSILGISSGAALGASMAILVLGGYGPRVLTDAAAAYAPAAVSLSAFAGATLVLILVTLLGSSGGRVSVPTLLLVGIALNAACGGLLTAIQSFVLEDFEIARAMMSWTFGTIDDRAAWHAGAVWAALLVSALVIPFVALELDLFAGGEEDARALGVHTQRTKLLALGAAALCASVAVAVAGQIVFVGLLVPHILRQISGRSHRSLLPLCLLGGPLFLVGTDLVQRLAFADAYLQPGVTMSLVGGPFFLYLLLRNRAQIQAW